MVLGWRVDTRTFRVHLSIKKKEGWTRSLSELLKVEKVRSKVLEKPVGRLNHAGFVLLQRRYFLNRLRRLLAQCQKYGTEDAAEDKGGCGVVEGVFGGGGLEGCEY